MRSKRKGTDVSIPSTVSIVSTSTPLEETVHLLKEMRVESNESVMNSLHTCFDLAVSLESEQAKLMTRSNRVKNELESRIQQAREACREESDDLYRIQVALKELHAEKDALYQELNEMNALESETREHICQYEKESLQEIESIDKVEAERMRQVPRLKQQISLYAMTTGVKWDFDLEDVLAGQVAIPKKDGFRRFAIDPKDYSEFEVANHLWSLMEGNPSPAVTSVY